MFTFEICSLQKIPLFKRGISLIILLLGMSGGTPGGVISGEREKRSQKIRRTIRIILQLILILLGLIECYLLAVKLGVFDYPLLE